MNRRNFLKGAAITPVIGLGPIDAKENQSIVRLKVTGGSVVLDFDNKESSLA